MNQAHFHSLLEASASTAVGFAISVVVSYVLLRWFGHENAGTESAILVGVLTVVSIVRGYLIRRLFIYLHLNKYL